MFPISQRMIINLGGKSKPNLILDVCKRNIQWWPEAPANATVSMPLKIEDRLLPQLPYTPTEFPKGVMAPLKHPKANIDMRGPEKIHNQLIYRQYGLIALGGGAFAGPHFDVIRDKINKCMNTERLFAIWRIDPPWKPKSKKSMGKKMGGGKAKVHHYETPIKAGRILIEVAGIGDYGEIEPVLKALCRKLPLYAMPISQEIMDNLKAEKLELDAKNYNPFEYRTLVRKNFSNSQLEVGRYDAQWGGTYF